LEFVFFGSIIFNGEMIVSLSDAFPFESLSCKESGNWPFGLRF